MGDPLDCDDDKKDYYTGEPRTHHKFYFPDGNIVFQVEKAIFKVYRYTLSKHSTVIRDLFSLPETTSDKDGTDEKPLVFVDDSVKGWETFLKLRRDPIQLIDVFSGDNLDHVFPLVVKYSMEEIEQSILKRLDTCSSVEDATNLIVISQMLNSDQLYQKAKAVLVGHNDSLRLEQANRIGAIATYGVMAARQVRNQEKILDSLVLNDEFYRLLRTLGARWKYSEGFGLTRKKFESTGVGDTRRCKVAPNLFTTKLFLGSEHDLCNFNSQTHGG
ncbi:7842_t:CDS:2, partial [Acaulospora colombiana]